MPSLPTFADCCGCTACASICPHDAIVMKPDALGFLYPVVDAEKCVDCRLCEKVCAFNDDYDKSYNLVTPLAFAARHKNIFEVMKSRSGGAFAALSDVVLAEGGVVYGAGYTDHFRVVHKRATTAEERDDFRGSKYVQSDLTGVFRQVKGDLKAGRTVLFSGTPCQTSGLRSFVGRELGGHLLLVDLVCHLVPSPFIWRDYIEYLEKKYGGKIVKANFRDKEHFGWSAHRERFVFDNGREVSTNAFTYLFYKHIMGRKSCGNCHFCNTVRPSDITVADYWGWEKTDEEINKDDKGVNLILINTEKGKSYFRKVGDRLLLVNAKIENCMQPQLCKPAKEDKDRGKFEVDYISGGYEYVVKKYGKDSWKQRFKNLKNGLVGYVRRVLKPILAKFKLLPLVQSAISIKRKQNRIGILTFSCACNYGAMLQCFALQETIKSLGYDVEVIDYRPAYLNYNIFCRFKILASLANAFRWMLKGKLAGMYENYLSLTRYKKFENTYYAKSPKTYKNKNGYADALTRYDLVFIGSDQVLNHKYNNVDPVWYGWKPEGAHCRIATYAASAGMPDFKGAEINLVNRYLRNYDNISVREDVLKNYLFSKFNIQATTVLDPTLLAPPQIWDSLKDKGLTRCISPSDSYLLIYQTRTSNSILDIADKLAAENGWSVLVCDDHHNWEGRGYTHAKVSPAEFVSLVANARCVVTSSFHGTAISIVCHTPFYTMRMNDGMDERSEGLLGTLGLSNRMIDKDAIVSFSSIDFVGVESKLQELRKPSVEFLINAIHAEV